MDGEDDDDPSDDDEEDGEDQAWADGEGDEGEADDGDDVDGLARSVIQVCIAWRARCSARTVQRGARRTGCYVWLWLAQRVQL